MSVLLPDMFVSFMACPAKANPHLDIVRQESESWLSQTCKFGPKETGMIHGLDFSYFCAVVIPFASASKLRLLCDWGNWIFPFDDAFDNGALKSDQVVAEKTLHDLMSIMNGAEIHTTEPLLQAFQGIWTCLFKSSEGVKKRFRKYMTQFCEANLQQVMIQPEGNISDIDELTDLRRGLICTTPIFALVERAYELDLPDHVIDNPIVEQLRLIVTDILWIQNDIVSYFKEKDLQEQHNLIAAYLLQGNNIQNAFDQAGELLESRYRDWHVYFAQLPFWGEGIDSELYLYLSGVRNVALANLNWSFKTDRYWYGQNENVRSTRDISSLIGRK